MCSSCSVEEETVYRINASRFQSQSQIAIDSTQIFRNSRNNTLNVEVRYQAKTYNAAYDSIKWEFPGGTPNNVSDVTERIDKGKSFFLKECATTFNEEVVKKTNFCCLCWQEKMKLKYGEDISSHTMGTC